MAIDDQRPSWGPVEPEGEQAPGAASIFAADPPGLGPAEEAFSAPAAPPPAPAPAPAPAAWAPILAFESEPAPQPAPSPAPPQGVFEQPALAAPSVEPWAPVPAYEAPPIPQPTLEPVPVPQPTPPSFTPAEELLPSPGGSLRDDAPPWSPPSFAAAPPVVEPAPAPADPVWQLGASAVQAANLQAAGAQAQPFAQQPFAQQPVDAAAAAGPVAPVSPFEPEQAFVPRFDPIGGVTPAAAPSLSFTEPAPRPPDPYSDVVVPSSDEPAYVPVVDLSQADRTHVVDADPLEPAALPTLSDEPAPPLTTRRSFLATAQPEETPAVAEPAFEQPVYEQPTYQQPVYEQPTYEQPVYQQPAYEHPTEPFPVPATDHLPTSDPATARLPWASVGATEALPAVAPAASAPPGAPQPGVGGAATGAAFPSPAAPFEAVAPPASADARETLLMPLAVDKPAKGRRGGKGAPTSGRLDVVAPDAAPKKPLRIVLLALGAVVIAAGLGYGVYRLFFWPDPVILAVPTITAPVPTPSADPIAVTDATDFGASMPDTVGTDVLMEFTSTDPLGDAELPARAAEHLTLAYGSGTGTPTFTIEAYQHYTVEEAETAYDAYADGKPDRADVEVNGEVVGERAWATEGDAGTVVWRNGTAVFVLTGPADDVVHFFEHFGV